MFVINNPKGTHLWLFSKKFSQKYYKLAFKWYKVPTMLLEKVSIHTEILFVHCYNFFFLLLVLFLCLLKIVYYCLKVQREHIYDYFQKNSAKNILHLYDISSYGKEKLNWPSLPRSRIYIVVLLVVNPATKRSPRSPLTNYWVKYCTTRYISVTIVIEHYIIKKIYTLFGILIP
jgi:cbb3-type cytochrome oxidase subunit 3